jgi:hypothetical protein
MCQSTKIKLIIRHSCVKFVKVLQYILEKVGTIINDERWLKIQAPLTKKFAIAKSSSFIENFSKNKLHAPFKITIVGIQEGLTVGC